MKESNIYINDILLPIGTLYYTVNKKTFEVEENRCDGQNNVSYNYYFSTSKEAHNISRWLKLQYHIGEAVCIPIRNTDPALADSIGAWIAKAFNNIVPHVKELVKDADGNRIWQKYHALK